MQQYVAFLRGINVGGNSLIKMADLKVCLSVEFANVRTFIQSGNVLFESDKNDKAALTKTISKAIAKTFGLAVEVAVFTSDEWCKVVADAPAWWGRDKEWKHNILIMLRPFDAGETIAAIGTLKPDIEELQAGDGVLYQSVEFAAFGKSTTGKLASNPLYKQMTIRNVNTATKIAALLG